MAVPRPSSAPIPEQVSAPILRRYAYTPSLDSAYRKETPFVVDMGIEVSEDGPRQRRGAAVEVESSSQEPNPILTPSSSNGEGDGDTTADLAAKLSSIQQLLAKLPWPPFSNRADGTRDASSNEEYCAKVKYDKLEEYMLGIPRLAALQDSNDSFCMARRFGYAGMRVVLHKAMVLDQLLKKLHQLDVSDNADDSLRYRLSSGEYYEGRPGWDAAQNKLMQEIETKLTGYWDFWLKYVDVRALAQVPEHNHRSVLNWLETYQPIYEGEEDFLFVIDDLVAAKRDGGATKHTSKIDELIDANMHKIPRGLLNLLFRDKNQDKKSEDGQIHHLTSARLVITGRFIVAIIAVITMLMPILLMFLLDLRKVIMASIVASFVVIFMTLTILVVDVTADNLFLCIAGYEILNPAKYGDNADTKE
ncbi:uncharacterized protein BP5553_04455 [Venustampulla echinocandica]|uniref:DUF6594 domain-containing protein n=1 Tax=Venustampulla echinocandica TaxID=2656787 RepID=A0A370TND0_9HELO|nr:uncharacterized protein BP5553_04455 [Venustampulla echinocandica]RDL37022.1 hypothetical protein BP5553_04455 [Venustampulla echinocandica]